MTVPPASSATPVSCASAGCRSGRRRSSRCSPRHRRCLVIDGAGVGGLALSRSSSRSSCSSPGLRSAATLVEGRRRAQPGRHVAHLRRPSCWPCCRCSRSPGRWSARARRFDAVLLHPLDAQHRPPLDAGGGAYHAIIGTIEQAGIATLITVPLGIAGAIYIVEYGRGRLADAIRFFVDVMTGIPSIVAGLFILAFWVLLVSPYFNDGRPEYSGFAAALALTVLMLPTVVRSTEEMLRLVPTALREGSYALGIPKWKTILRIVLPTAARASSPASCSRSPAPAGETAPVLLVAGGTDVINIEPVQRATNRRCRSIVFEQAGVLDQVRAPPRAWAAALTLVVARAHPDRSRRSFWPAATSWPDRPTKRCFPWPSASKPTASRLLRLVQGDRRRHDDDRAEVGRPR